MDDAGTRTSGRPPARGRRPELPPVAGAGRDDRPGRPAPAPAKPTQPAPPAPPRRIDSLLDAVTRVIPRHSDLPTRRLARVTPDEPPTALIAAAAPAPSTASPALQEPPEPAPIEDEPRRPATPGTPPARATAPARSASPIPTRVPGKLQPDSRRRDPRTLQRALLAAAISAVAPGSGHLLLRHRRTGALLLGLFVFGVVMLVVLALTLPRAQLLENLLSTRVLIVAVIICLGAAATWMGVIVHAYRVGRPRRLRTGQRLLGAATVTALCLVVAAPLGLAAHLANSQRSLLDALFPSAGAGAAAAIGKPRLNILLVGSDAGPDRTGTRTDTMMVASVDTKSGRTTLFGLPRNIGHARFPPGSLMAAEFPDGFHSEADPLSGDYLLNAVYAYGHSFPKLAPKGPTNDPGLNLLQSSISYMLGLPVDYQIVVDMAGFAALIDALGGLRVDVGPERITIGGIGPQGQKIRPEGYIEPGVQQLSGEEALAFARSRTGSTDYVRMGRQRCLIQYVLDQKSPTNLLTNFQSVARATTDSVSTNIPREVLPALVSLAGGSGTVALESVAFDPNLPDPDAPDGKFNTFSPNIPYMRDVVREAINRPPPGAAPPASAPTRATAPPTPSASRAAAAGGSSASTSKPGSSRASGANRTGSASASSTATAGPAATAAPQSLAQSC